MIKLFLVLITFTYLFHISFGAECIPKPGEPVNSPIGEPLGIFPGRVTWAFDKSATTWDGESDFFWSEKYLDQNKVQQMLDKTILKLGGGATISRSWNYIFEYFNLMHYGKPLVYKNGEKISIKLNLNQDGIWGYKNENGNEVTPQFMKALIRQLVNEVGIPQEDITIWDASRLILPKFIESPEGLSEEFPNINFRDSLGEKPWVEQVKVDKNSYFEFSDDSIPDFNQTKVPTVLTEAKYLIVVNAFRSHTMCGITATPKNFFGGIWRPNCICELPEYKTNWCPKDLHDYTNSTAYPMGSYSLLVDLIGNDYMYGGKGLIDFTDGLYGGPAQIGGPDRSMSKPCLFQMPPMNNHWSSSIFASLDPVALDSVLFDFLRNEPSIPFARAPGNCVDNYLHEGALANDPPSGTIYKPSGKQLGSLGVHEHWNNVEEKKYSKNLGKDTGIELVQV